MSVLGVLMLLAGTAHAAPPGVRHVRAEASPGGDGLSWATAYNNLRQALVAAGVSGGGITELWVKEGTYLPSPAPVTDRTLSFTLVAGVGVYGGFAGTEMDRDQRDPGARATIINGSGVYNVVTGAGNSATVLDGFTITGGRANGSSPARYSQGAGIHVTGSPVIRGCTIIANDLGGAGLTSHPVRLGAGAYCAPGSAATFIDCVFASNVTNTAYYLSGGLGGGLAAVDCSLTLTRCTFTQNRTGDAGLLGCSGGQMVQARAGDGAGLYMRNSAAIMTDCTLIGNTTGNGVLSSSCSGSAVDATDAGDGAGLYAKDSTVLIVNSLLAGNRTGSGGAGVGGFTGGSDGGDGGDGGAVLVSGGSVHLVNCTLADNAVGVGGAGGPMSGGQPGNPGANGVGAGLAGGPDSSLENCIIWNDGASQIVAATAAYSDIRGGYAGPGNISIDPLFIDVAAGDYRLQATSPCIDAGNSLVDTDPSAPGTQPLPSADLDGQPRRIDIAAVADTGIGAPVVDMGAYEAQAGCAIDYTGDGLVDFSDYLEFLNLYNSADDRADLNGDGLVDFSDYLEFLNLYDGDC